MHPDTALASTSRAIHATAVTICTKVESFPQTLGGNFRTVVNSHHGGHRQQDVEVAPENDGHEPPGHDARLPPAPETRR